MSSDIDERERADAGALAKSRVRPRRPHLAGRRVLLADDCLDTRELYKLYLEAAGLRVDCAEDGSKALQMAVDLRPDVIVMDVSMPRLNGDAVAAELRIGVETRHIPIVLITAYGHAARAQAEAVGCDAFLTKPCLPETLLSVLAEMMGRARRTASR